MTRGQSGTLKPGLRLSFLDALRGIAALTVLWHHVFVLYPNVFENLATSAPMLWSAAYWVSGQNKNAVLLFFVISGFSIRLALEKDDIFKTGGPSLYAKRRAARILPLYWVALLWTALLGLLSGSKDPSFGFPTLIGNLLFLQTSEAARGAWFAPYGLNGPLWSLSYEVAYYVILPVVLLLAGRTQVHNSRFTERLLIISLITSVGAIGISYALPSPLTSFLGLWHVWVFGYFIGDCFLRERRTKLIAIPAAAALAAQALMKSVGVNSATVDLLTAGIFIATGLSVTMLLAKKFPNPIKRTVPKIVTNALSWLGGGSYAIYLLHYPLLLALSQFGLGSWSFWHILIAFSLLAVFVIVLCPLLEQSLRDPGFWLVGLARKSRRSASGIKNDVIS
ncbi:MAG: acyltransferase family protein [Beijerinckiaceae bacterium]